MKNMRKKAKTPYLTDILSWDDQQAIAMAAKLAESDSPISRIAAEGFRNVAGYSEDIDPNDP